MDENACGGMPTRLDAYLIEEGGNYLSRRSFTLWKAIQGESGSLILVGKGFYTAACPDRRGLKSDHFALAFLELSLSASSRLR